jgi:septum formation protein
MDNSGMHPKLILGSTSRYRRELLERLRIPFQVEAPGVDETALPGESPRALALRLALEKARAVACRHPGSVVIGSDQVADLNGQALGKPGTHEKAVAQLRAMSGQVVVFQTALALVVSTAEASKTSTSDEFAFEQSDLAAVTVRFRTLTDEDIETYLRLDQPYDCAGSARSESLGITLLDSIESDDPTALVGLPLIRTARLLRAAGLDPLQAAA